MIQSSSAGFVSVISLIKRSGAFLLLIGILSLSGCGSTKVYTADKTLVYGSDIYNLATVQRVGSRVEATLPSGDKLNPQQMDKKAFNAMLDENQSVLVTTFVELDDQEFVYQDGQVTRYSHYTKMMKRHESAMDDIRKFMGNKKSTQLDLK